MREVAYLGAEIRPLGPELTGPAARRGDGSEGSSPSSENRDEACFNWSMTTFLNAEAFMKTLEILERSEPEFKNTFVCEVETMFGDADDDATITFAITTDIVDDLEKLFSTLQKTDDADYHKVKNFARFFVLPCRYEDEFEYEGEAPALETGTDWPFDSDCDYYYGYERHRYFWFDEHGLKHEARVVTKKNPKE